MKKFLVCSLLFISSFAMAQVGVKSNTNTNTNNLPSKEKDTVEIKPFLNPPSDSVKKEDNYKTNNGFWNKTTYGKFTFYGCEVKLNSYMINLRDFRYIKINGEKIEVHAEYMSEDFVVSKNDMSRFEEEYTYRRAICLFQKIN